MRVEHKHNFGKKKAYEKINRFLSQLQKEHSKEIANPQKKWDPERNKMYFSVEMFRRKIEGYISLSDSKVVLETKLPFFSRLLEGKIHSIIKEQMEKTFA